MREEFKEAMKPSIQFLKRADGVKIAYTKFGKGEPLVFAPAWVTSLSYIIEDKFANRFWEMLAQQVTVILYDKHGCGQSDRDRKSFTLEAELLDLETVINHLELNKFNLMGSSCSAPVSITYAAKHREKVSRLILYGGYACGAKIAKEDFKSALISMVKASWGLGSKTMADIFVPGANTEELRSLAKFQRESASPEIAAKLLELTYVLDASQVLSHVNVPTLILHREADKTITIDHGRQLAAEIPNARFKLLKGAIHPWWYGKVDEIIKEIAEFVGGGNSADTARDISHISSMKDLDEEMGDIPIDGTEIVEQATILFSDIVSSTDLVTQLGDAAARDIFLQHDRIVRNQLRKYGGKELQNLGDGFMLSFESPSAAVKCACSIQQEIYRTLPSIKVRMGINTGEVVIREGKHPFGQAVVLASRIASRANGEEILVSDVTKQLASGSKLPFAPKGRFKPKGFDETVKLHEITWKE